MRHRAYSKLGLPEAAAKLGAGFTMHSYRVYDVCAQARTVALRDASGRQHLARITSGEDRFFLREFFVFREDDQCTTPE